MKVFIAMMLLLSVSFSYTYAGEEYESYEKKEPTSMEEREVIYYDFDLEAEVENGVVEAEWDEYDGEGFDWFKLVYSNTNSNPVYPVDQTVFVGSKNQTETSFKLKGGYENHYIRICAVILNDDYSKDRYCGETLKIEWDGEYEKEEYKKEYVKKVVVEKTKNVCTMEYAPVCANKNGTYKIYSNNCLRESANAIKVEMKYCEKNIQTSTKKESTFSLSLSLRERINSLLESFIEGLSKKGYSDEKIGASIDIVIERLVVLKKQEKYKNIAEYMIQELEAMKVKYSDPLEELESIFDGF